VKKADLDYANAPRTVMKIIKIAAERALSGSEDSSFQLIHSCSYKDSENHQMLSVTGVVTDDVDSLNSHIRSWPFFNQDWESPELLNLPILSLKERLKLERFLPSTSCTRMKNSLPYGLGGGTTSQLEQYRQYYRLLPAFAKFDM
jgi:hypothetical protein